MEKPDIKKIPKAVKIIGVIVAAILLLVIGSAIGQSGKQTPISSTKVSSTTVAATTKPTTTTTPTKTQNTTSTPSTTTTTKSATTTTSKATSTPASAPAAPKVLLNLSGNGIENSAPFLVTESQLTVTYSYDCSADGGTGNFIADLLYGDQSSLNSDDQSIANVLSSGATNVTTTIYPANPGNDYYLSVNSECSWTVTVSS